LPANRSEGERNLVSTSVRAEAYVEEALGWLPGAAPSRLAAQEIDAPRGMLGLGEREHVLVAEDNADMRAYVRHVLGPHCYRQRHCGDRREIRGILLQSGR
jgi:hypothetical protein